MAVRVPTQWLLTLVLIGTGLGGLRTPHAAAAPAYADNVVIIMVDGLRPDALKQAKVPTLDGLVGIKVPAGSPPGRVFRLRGQGLPSPEGNGDILATLAVDLPKNLSRREREIFEELRSLGR